MGDRRFDGTKISGSLGLNRSGEIDLTASLNSENEIFESPSKSSLLMIAVISALRTWCPIFLRNILILPSVR